MMQIKEIRVGVSSCGLAAGAQAVVDKLKQKTDVTVLGVGCIGHCYAEPLVEVVTADTAVLYGNVSDKDKDIDAVLSLAEEKRLDVRPARSEKENLKITGIIGKFEPTDIDAYMSFGGFEGLKKALAMPASDVVTEVKDSFLRGRGGGGFPTGVKWSLLANKEADEKVLICNADEGDPGAFMDRSLMESLPYQVLEGMLIAAHATAASKIFIYCRAEYPLAIKNVKIAIETIKARGLNVINGKGLDVQVKEGAGAFVCGEETALIHSLEGKRGMPRFRPPYPTDSGYLGLPSMISNVETFANVPIIIREGAAAYAAVGTEGGRGTKLFALAGDVKYPGLVEVPMGVTLAEIIYGIGGAEPGSVKAVQTGGPSGGCIPARLFDTPVDYDSLNSLGAIMGSGGLIVIGNNRCMVETARYFLDFTHRESCGKCTFCRVGAKRMFEALERITGGEGTAKDVTFLEEMGKKVKAGSLCGLGATAPNPVLATLRYFKEEFDAHVVDRQCPAMECAALSDVAIHKENCTECGLCIKNCAVNAISDDYIVDNRICTRCNSCIEACPQNTISRIPGGSGFSSSADSKEVG
ncbi:MAG: 4Fe-4S binding protein [Deltaproteobacteria bacterium]|nr:4Fe-4S binding protein [Deltaproteobacteria bacterium]MBN2671848.1 4Fe-4S binding protein [Deltaproteobacteria bacterium]